MKPANDIDDLLKDIDDILGDEPKKSSAPLVTKKEPSSMKTSLSSTQAKPMVPAK